MRRYRRPLVVILAAFVIIAMVLTILLGVARADSGLPPDLHAEVSHVAVSRSGDGVAVAYMSTVINSGKDPSAAFSIPIPAAATKFELLEGAAKVTRSGEQVVVPAGIAPGGSSAVGFRYTLPDGITELHYPDIPPADMAMLLIDEATLTLTTTGPGLSEKGLVVLGQQAYRQYIVSRPAPGMNLTVQLKLEGNPANAAAAIADAQKLPPGAPVDRAEGPLLNQTFHGGNANVMLWQRMTGSTGHGGLAGLLLIGLLLLALVLGAIFLLARRRQATSAAFAPMPPASTRGRAPAEAVSLQKQKAQLARRIAEIDRTPADERTPELDDERESVKQQLVEVILRLRRLESHAD